MELALSEAVAPLVSGQVTALEWRGLLFEVTLRRSKRARRARLRVVEGRMEIVLPQSAPLRLAFELLRHHEEWAYRALQRASRPTLSRLMYAGDPLRVVSRHGPGPLAVLQDGVLTVWGLEPERQVRAWFRSRSELALREALDRRCQEMGLWPRQVQVRDQKTKWGACTSRGTVTLNWRIVMAPPDVLDYLVVHELAHLRELNHSSRYWAIVERHCPEHRRFRRWLRENGHALHLPDPIPIEPYGLETGSTD